MWPVRDRNPNRKEWVIRHGRSPRGGLNAQERAIEKKVRQHGQREVREAEGERYNDQREVTCDRS